MFFGKDGLQAMLQTGILGTAMALVTDENTAIAMGSGDLPVFATPSMVALMEAAASKSLAPYLEAGKSSVGTKIDIKHLAATPVGMQCRAESELIELDGKRLVFTVKAFDEAGIIGEGLHERFVIDGQRFLEKAEGKRRA